MTTVPIDQAGQIGLPEAVLNESGLEPGAELVVLVHKGKITLVDREHFRELVEKPTQELLVRVCWLLFHRRSSCLSLELIGRYPGEFRPIAACPEELVKRR